MSVKLTITCVCVCVCVCVCACVRCVAGTCFLSPKNTFNNSGCNGKCAPIKLTQWLLLKGHWKVGVGGLSATVVASPGTYLKKSERISGQLPPADKRFVTHGTVEHFRSPLLAVDEAYWIGDLRWTAMDSWTHHTQNMIVYIVYTYIQYCTTDKSSLLW